MSYPTGWQNARVGTGQSLFVCPVCGCRAYRAGRYVPSPTPTFKGDEIRLPEICSAPPAADATYQGLCRGEMVWTPESSAHDLLPDSFEVDLGDGKGTRRIASVSELRAIERDSEKMTRNEPGKAPIIWRDLTQDRSNRDKNVFAGTSFERGRPLPPPKRRTTQGRPIQVRRGGGDDY